MTVRDDNAGELFDLLADAEQVGGLTKQEVLHELGWGNYRFKSALERARSIFAGSDMGNIVALAGEGRSWRYLVTSDLATARPWVVWMWKNTVTRLHTTLEILKPMEQLTDGRSRMGRKVRALQRHLSRAIEDLEQIDADYRG